MPPDPREAPRRLSRHVLVLALTGAAFASIPLAQAENVAAAAPVVVVLGYNSDSSDAAELVARGLPDGWKRSDTDSFKDTLRAEKATSAPNKAFDTIASRQAFAGRLRRAGLTARVDVVVMVRSVEQPGGSKIDLMIVSVDRDTAALDATYLVVGQSPDLGGATSAMASTLRSLPAHARIPAAAPASAPPPAASAPPPPQEPAPEASPRPSYLSIAVGGETQGRFLSYRDSLSSSLSTYDLGISPALLADLELRPLAGMSPAVRGLTLHGEYHQDLGLMSRDAVTRESRATTWRRWEADLRWRFELAPLTYLGPSVGVLSERFAIENASLAPPSIDALFVRLGVDARIAAGPVAVLAQGAYLLSLSGGELADRMRDTSLGGVEGGLGVAVPLGAHVELRAQGLYTRMFYSFHPVPGDRYVAGGALDQMVRAQLLAAAVF